MSKMMTFRELMARLPRDGEIRHALRRFNFGMASAGEIPSVSQLARSVGFDVRLASLPGGVRGRLVTDTFSKNGFCIEVNEKDGVRIRRWTVLHEMMHAFLHHRDDPFAEPHYRAGKDHFYMKDELVEEREANACVEALVFGENALLAAIQLHGSDHEMIARKFGVSLPTLMKAMSKL